MSFLPVSQTLRTETSFPPFSMPTASPVSATRQTVQTSPEGKVLQPSGRLLLADDDPSVRELLCGVLVRAGFHTEWVGDGETAWAFLCVNHYDVLITDNDMPRLSGLDLLRRMRPSFGALPVIFISGCMPWDDPDFSRLLSPGAVMEKPFSPFELVGRVRQLLAGCGASLETRIGTD